MLSAHAGWPRRGWHFLVNALAFSLCYPLANLLAQEQGVRRHLMLGLDGAIPFLPWMIIPYMSSGIFFTMSFIWVRSDDEVRVLSQRLLLATVSACLVFAFYPLRFSLARPAVEAPLLRFLFDGLTVFDRPYNQLPSLHVAYCLIFWQSLRGGLRLALARAALTAWLTLVAISTLFTYQHHALDLAGGLLLGAATLRLVRPGREHAAVAFYYLMAAGILLLAGVLVLHCLALLYPVASFALVSLAYWRDERHFLRKQDGRHPWWICLLYGPYLLCYRLTWHGVRLRERHRPPCRQWAPQLWVGRRLTRAEAAQLPANCISFDLAQELSEIPALRGPAYRHFPLLDVRPVPPAVADEIVAAMIAEMARGSTLYLHCAMGYSRSIFIAKYYMAHMDKTAR